MFDVLVDRRPRHDRPALRGAPAAARRGARRRAELAVPAHRVGDGAALLEATGAQELEGVMAKRLGTTYRPGRPLEGLAQGQEPAPRRGRHRRLHAGHAATARRRSARCSSGAGSTARLAFAGGVGTGFNQRRLEELTARLRRRCAPTTARSTRRRRRPTGAARRGSSRCCGRTVEITEFTNEGYVRQASFIDLVETRRDDRRRTHGARRSTPPTRWPRGGDGS